MENNENRKHRRIHSLNLSYVCLDEEGRIVKQGMGRTLNLSESGILLETHFAIALEHTVILSMGLEDLLVDMRGRPIHVRSARTGLYEVGIEFIDPDEDALTTVREFLKSAAFER
jgi:hypothetical protein